MRFGDARKIVNIDSIANMSSGVPPAPTTSADKKSEKKVDPPFDIPKCPHATQLSP
jgi:hypothetical protein